MSGRLGVVLRWTTPSLVMDTAGRTPDPTPDEVRPENLLVAGLYPVVRLRVRPVAGDRWTKFGTRTFVSGPGWTVSGPSPAYL